MFEAVLFKTHQYISTQNFEPEILRAMDTMCLSIANVTSTDR